MSNKGDERNIISITFLNKYIVSAVNESFIVFTKFNEQM